MSLFWFIQLTRASWCRLRASVQRKTLSSLLNELAPFTPNPFFSIAWIYQFVFICLILCIQVFSGNNYKEQDLPVRHVFIRALYTRYVKFHVTRWVTPMQTLSLRVEIYGKRMGKKLNNYVINNIGVSRLLKEAAYFDFYKAVLIKGYYGLFLFYFGTPCSHPQLLSSIKWTSSFWLPTPPSVLQVSDIRWHHRTACSAATSLGVLSSMTICNT